MKKKLVPFICAVMAALCLAVSVPVQAYAAPKDEIALQYTGISEISATLKMALPIAGEQLTRTETTLLIWLWS